MGTGKFNFDLQFEDDLDRGGGPGGQLYPSERAERFLKKFLEKFASETQRGALGRFNDESIAPGRDSAKYLARFEKEFAKQVITETIEAIGFLHRSTINPKEDGSDAEFEITLFGYQGGDVSLKFSLVDIVLDIVGFAEELESGLAILLRRLADEVDPETRNGESE